MIRLSVQDGKMVQTLSLSGDKVFIGRLPANTIRLEHPSVSRKHCLIRRNGPESLELLDLNSRHGTRRNGDPVERSPLAVGDELLVGEVRIRVEALEGIAVPPTPSEKKGLLDRLRGERPDAPPDPANPGKILLSNAYRQTFSEELYRQVRKTPWWAMSLCVHAVLVWLLFIVPFATPVGEHGLGVVTGKIEQDFSKYLVDDLPDPKVLAESPRVATAPLRAPPLDEKIPVPVEPRVPPEVPLAVLPPDLGPGRMNFAPEQAKTSPFADASIPDTDFGKEGAESANEKAGDLLRKSFHGRPGETIGLLSRLKASDVLVVRGHYDKVETVLDLLDLPHTDISVPKLDRSDLAGVRVLIINCSNEVPSRATLHRIREFVREGGYLLTTDWGIENVLRYAFEGYLEPVPARGLNATTLDDEVIRIHAARDQKEHFLLDGTSLFKGEAKWWLEESSYPFLVKRKDDVEVLIQSDDLQRQFGCNSVAATFRFGEGRVLHMLGHFFQKQGNLKGAFSAQRLIANFLVAAIRRK